MVADLREPRLLRRRGRGDHPRLGDRRGRHTASMARLGRRRRRGRGLPRGRRARRGARPAPSAGVLPTPPGMVDLVAGAALSWKQLVTIAVPGRLVPGAAGAAVPARAHLRHPRGDDRPAQPLPGHGGAPARAAARRGHRPRRGSRGASRCRRASSSSSRSSAWLVRVAIAKRRAITRVRRAEGAVADARRVLGASALIAVALDRGDRRIDRHARSASERRPRRAAAAVRAARARQPARRVPHGVPRRGRRRR